MPRDVGTYVKMNFDAKWRQEALEGHPAAIGRLVDAVMPGLYAFCLYRVGRNRHLCEEVVQETLMQALGRLHQYDPARAGGGGGGDIFPWLVGLARNIIQRELSRETSAVSLEALWTRMDSQLLDVYAQLDSTPFSDEVLAREETRDIVNMTMSQLPAHYRQVLEAKYVRGASVRDMAEEGATTEKSVESMLSRAREAFRATFTALAGNLDSGQWSVVSR
jgi:RNA polymerase sigma-70 factor, ECF subfamily